MQTVWSDQHLTCICIISLCLLMYAFHNSRGEIWSRHNNLLIELIVALTKKKQWKRSHNKTVVEAHRIRMYPYMCIAGCSIEIVIYDESYHMQKRWENGFWIAQFTGKSQKKLKLGFLRQVADTDLSPSTSRPIERINVSGRSKIHCNCTRWTFRFCRRGTPSLSETDA